MNNINILTMIIVIVLVFLLLNNSVDRYISLGEKNKSSLVIILLITIIIFMLLQDKGENFKNINEDIFTGIKGKTTMSNLQNLQNNEIQLLEEKARFVKSFLQKKNDQIEQNKYKKIPIENSCMVLNSNGSINLSKPLGIDSQSLPLSTESNLSKQNFDSITDMLNS